VGVYQYKCQFVCHFALIYFLFGLNMLFSYDKNKKKNGIGIFHPDQAQSA
jgi:hypothetical protein